MFFGKQPELSCGLEMSGPNSVHNMLWIPADFRIFSVYLTGHKNKEMLNFRESIK